MFNPNSKNQFSFDKDIPEKVIILQKVWEKLPPFKQHPNKSVIIGYLDCQVYVAISDRDLFGIMFNYKQVCLKALHDNVSFIVTGIHYKVHTDVSELLSALNSSQKQIHDKRKITYNDYLESAAWRTLVKQKLVDAEFRCQVCNSQQHLHVHHRTYRNRGRENLKDLTVLCQECHSLFHRHNKILGE